MKTCKVLRTITLTVEPESHVIVSDTQFELAKGNLEKISDLINNKSLNEMTKAELLILGKSKGKNVLDTMTKTQLVAILEK